jgi:GNAT superfamily N-acetyltransferase
MMQAEKTIEIVIRLTDSLSDEERNAIDTVDHLAFFEEGEDENDEIEWALSSTWGILGNLDGVLVSYIGILRRVIRVGGEDITVGGIGGVATHPAWRRRGYAHALLKAAAEFMQKEGDIDFTMLFCSCEMIPYYQKSGYRLVKNPLYITQSSGRLRFDDNYMVLPVSGKPWPEGEIDISGPPW